MPKDNHKFWDGFVLAQQLEYEEYPWGTCQIVIKCKAMGIKTYIHK